MLGLKVALLGDVNAGKTALVESLVGDRFLEDYQTTIGCKFNKKQIDKQELHLWDVSGQARYRPHREGYVNDSAVIMYCVDLSRQPLDHQTIQSEITHLTSQFKVPIILVGTKSDLCNNAEAILSSIEADVKGRVVTSAKNTEGLKALEETIIRAAQQCPSNPSPTGQFPSVVKHIQTLQKEINSCWPYPHKDRKQHKVDALEKFLRDAEELGAKEALRILNTNPSAREGYLSTRTSDLMDELEREINQDCNLVASR